MERLHDGFVLSGRYMLSKRLASGGMGQVWEAVDDLLDRPVAVKIMHPHTTDDEALVERFRDEAQYSAKLRSSHIVGVYDYGEDDGLAYLVMELVPGSTVAQLIRAGGALQPLFTASVLSQVAQGLAVAHEGGIIHRDVKPSNILVTPEGEAKLSDFGIAHAVEGASRTLTGEVLGTPQYLSPEQARGEEASAASDLYSLGIVGHEMLTGTKPFDRPTPVATALAHLTDPAPPLTNSVPVGLAALVMACLAKDPGDRPASAQELAQELSRETAELARANADVPASALPTAEGGPAMAAGAGGVPPAPFPSRSQIVLAGAATIIVVLLCIAAIML
jgi:eukaryotic-like serine/threonine-protein kinase